MNKVIYITGGSDGLGKSIAKQLVKDNTVIINSHSREKLEKAAKELGCSHGIADVSDFKSLNSSIQGVIDDLGKIDVMINNAAIWIQGELIDNDPEHIKRTIEVNLTGVINGCRAVLPSMLEKGVGQIINISSQAALYTKPERTIYNATKWGLKGFTRSLQQEVAGTGVRVTDVYPGKMHTKLFEKVGVDKDMSGAIETEKVARLVKMIVDTESDIHIPEIGVKSDDYSIKQSK